MTSFLNNSLPHVLSTGLTQLQERNAKHSNQMRLPNSSCLCQVALSSTTENIPGSLLKRLGPGVKSVACRCFTTNGFWKCQQYGYKNHVGQSIQSSLIHQYSREQSWVLPLRNDVKHNAMNMFNIQAVSEQSARNENQWKYNHVFFCWRYVFLALPITPHKSRREHSRREHRNTAAESASQNPRFTR